MPTTVGNRIKSLRIEQGFTLPALADKASLSKGLLYQIETSEDANPSLDTMSKIAKALGVTIALLLDKETVKARRIVPESIEPGLEEYMKECKERGDTLNQDTLQALYVLQHRTGAGAKTKEDWAWLYRSIEFSFGQRAKRNAPEG
ncbi:helix-turn-helix domain-containing protein [Oleiharenicola lentus]|uniref:helix-turn-helix domain-containing protein n=1 Tax=Oleiharenicola lentus TaxID=2508720 RepID=UPI003F67BB9B